MNQTKPTTNRKQLENKIAIVFKNNIRSLSVENRQIIVDDLVSAFENRLSALVRAQSHLNLVPVVEGEISVEAQ